MTSTRFGLVVLAVNGLMSLCCSQINAADTTSEAQVIFYDMLPTLAELAGVKSTAATDGLSIVPTLLGRGPQATHEFLYWEAPSGEALTQVVRLGDWKLLKSSGKKTLELYNLATDQAEERNVAADNPKIVAQLERIMQREHTPEQNYADDPRMQGPHTFVK